MGSCQNLAAALKRRMTVQTVSRAPDGQGGFTETWQDVADVWASLEPVKAYERYQAAQLQAPVTHKIVTRYTPVLTPAARLKYGARVFDVKEVINRNEENRFLDVRAIEA